MMLLNSRVLLVSAAMALSACAAKQNPAPVSDANQNGTIVSYDNTNSNSNSNNMGNMGNTGTYDPNTSTSAPSFDASAIQNNPTNSNPYNETAYNPASTYTPTTPTPTTSGVTGSSSSPRLSGTNAAIQELVGNVNGVYYGNYSPVDKSASIHIVQKGDTVYNISKRYGITQDTLRSLNGLSADNTISLGQSLRVKATGNKVNKSSMPSSSSSHTSSHSSSSYTAPKPATPAPTPTPAVAVVADKPAITTTTESVTTTSDPLFLTQSKSGITWQAPTEGSIRYPFGGDNKGVDIGGTLGQPIYASADGEVVYSGTGLRGYGKLIIIKHNETYLTAYGNNDTLLVEEKQKVKRGQQIAKMGKSDSSNGVKLHFELRENGSPVNPSNFIKFTK